MYFRHYAGKLMSSQTNVNRVAILMEMGMAGPGAPDATSPGVDNGNVGNVMAGMMDTMGVTPEEESYAEFSDEEMKLAKRFIEIVGCPERSEELLAKALEGFEYLGMIDDNETDAASIGAVAKAVPFDMDATTTIAHLVSSFDPNAG